MAVISLIKSAASAVGIDATVTNSDEKLQTKLNRIKDAAEEPQALIAWDLTTSFSFNEHGFVNDPTTPVTMLLMKKADSATKDDREKAAEEMGTLFYNFIVQLRKDLVAVGRTTSPGSLITGAQFQIVPKYGLGKHSGIIGRFSMVSDFSNC